METTRVTITIKSFQKRLFFSFSFPLSLPFQNKTIFFRSIVRAQYVLGLLWCLRGLFFLSQWVEFSLLGFARGLAYLSFV